MYLRNRVKPITYRNAAALKKRPTESEKLLRKHLNQQDKYTFKTQVILAGYIADFYCASVRVVVEVDGSSHNGKSAHDERRDFVLRSRFKIITLRFSVSEVLTDVNGVVGKILRFCDGCQRVTRSPKRKRSAP